MANLLAGLGLLIKYRQSTGQGVWIYRGWPHWVVARWYAYDASTQVPVVQLFRQIGYYLVNALFFFAVVCVFYMLVANLLDHTQRHKSKKLIIYTCLFSLVGIVCGFGIYLSVALYGQSKIVSQVDDPYKIAIVFGAGLINNTRPSDVLYDRVKKSVELYEQGIISRILMSGDNRFVEYNEPEVMKRTAIEMGVPETDLVVDYAGRRTYDTCYRAAEIFEIDQAILVTNEFHLPRALYLCSRMGIQVVGIGSDYRTYLNMNQWQLRETAAILVAWYELNISKPVPILGEKIIINYSSSGSQDVLPD